MTAYALEHAEFILHAEEFIQVMNELMIDDDFLPLTHYGKIRNWLENVKLSENQKSDILQWLLDPNEGHDLGDFFIKRLITAVHQTADQLDSEAKQKYFQQRIDEETWLDLADVMLADFGSAIVAREVPISQKGRRIDLLIVVPGQSVIIAIERKDGSTASANQLGDYKRFIDKNYSEYYSLFVLSDSYDQTHKHAENDIAWIKINDDWLIAALEEATVPGRTDERTSARLEELSHLLAETYADKETYYKGLEDKLSLFCQKNQKIIDRLAPNPFTSVTTNFLLTEHAALLSDPGEKLALYKAFTLAQKYQVLIESFIAWGRFEILKKKIEEAFPDETICFDERVRSLCFTPERIDSVTENKEFKEWPLYACLLLPEKAVNEEDSELPLPSLELKFNKQTAGVISSPAITDSIIEEYNLPVKIFRATKRIAEFETVEQAFDSLGLIKGVVKDMIAITQRLVNT